MRRSLSLAAAVAALVLAAVAPSQAAPGAVVATIGFTFVPGDADLRADTLHITRGMDVVFANLEVSFFAPHSLTSAGCRPNTTEPCRFDSGTIDFRGSTTVVTSSLAAGRYGFYCKVHPDTMTGAIVVI